MRTLLEDIQNQNTLSAVEALKEALKEKTRTAITEARKQVVAEAFGNVEDTESELHEEQKSPADRQAEFDRKLAAIRAASKAAKKGKSSSEFNSRSGTSMLGMTNHRMAEDESMEESEMTESEESFAPEGHHEMLRMGFKFNGTNSSPKLNAHTSSYSHPKGHVMLLGHSSSGDLNNWVSQPNNKKAVFGSKYPQLQKHLSSFGKGK